VDIRLKKFDFGISSPSTCFCKESWTERMTMDGMVQILDLPKHLLAMISTSVNVIQMSEKTDKFLCLRGMNHRKDMITNVSHTMTGGTEAKIRDGKRESHAPRRQHQASTHSKPPPQRSRDRQDNKRSGRQSEGERGANLQRIMNAQRSSEESKKDAELRRERKLLEKATQEAERNIFRKRDRSRDRQDDTKRSKGEEAKDKSEEEFFISP